jgi:hypothetical protein
LFFFQEHEKTCLLEDDVIICDDDDDEVEFVGTHIDQKPMSDFLLNFNLQNANVPLTKTRSNYNAESIAGSPEKLKRLPRKSRGTIALSRCNAIPLSSPCGVLLMKRAKTIMTEDYQMERLDRLERFCFAPALKVGANRPKWFGKGKHLTNCAVTYKKPHDHIKQPYHTFKFPRRQFWNTSQRKNLAFIKSLQLAKCKPLSINLQRLSKRDIEVHMSKLNQYKNKLISLKKKAERSTVVEFIDLCSSSGSDDEDEEDEVEVEVPEKITLCSDDENSTSNVQTENMDTTIFETTHVSASQTQTQVQIPSQIHLQPLRTSYLFSNNIESTNILLASPTSEPIDNFSSKSTQINEWLNNNARKSNDILAKPPIEKVLSNTLCTRRNLAANFTT